MNPAYRAALNMFLAVMTVSVCWAQEPASEWQGEWGAFRLIPHSGATADRYPGAGISITSCRETQCSFSITVHELDGSHGDANGTLRIGSEATADGQIEAHGYGYQCSLSLTKAGSQPPAIVVKQISPGCSNFLTPGASFAHTFPLRSKSNFYGNDLPLCYLAEDTARVALCGSQPLSKLEDDWRRLSYKTSDLSHKPIEVPEEEGKLVRACDDASDPAACLTGAFQSSMDAMNANNLAWLESVTEPGGADEAAPKIEAMAGSYRHKEWSFAIQLESAERQIAACGAGITALPSPLRNALQAGDSECR